MTDSGRPDPFGDVISLVAGPIATVIRSFDQLRKNADEMRRGIENFNTTMETLNETAGRVNRMLSDFEEPIRAMIPQLTRTVKLADDLSRRISGPMDQVIPGLTRLADTLNSPVLSSLPRDLGQFIEVINDLSRRMSPLGQLAEQASGLFGLRIPGLSSRVTASPAAPPPAAPVVEPPAPEEPTLGAPSAPTNTGRAPAKKPGKQRAPAKKTAATNQRAAPTKKRAAAKKRA